MPDPRTTAPAPGSPRSSFRPDTGPQVDRACVRGGRHGRNRGLPDISVTRSDIRDGSVPLPSLPRHAPVTVLPRLSYPALSPRPQPAQGRGERAESLLGRQLAVSDPFRAPPCEVSSLPGASLRGPTLFEAPAWGAASFPRAPASRPTSLPGSASFKAALIPLTPPYRGSTSNHRPRASRLRSAGSGTASGRPWRGCRRGCRPRSAWRPGPQPGRAPRAPLRSHR